MEETVEVIKKDLLDIVKLLTSITNPVVPYSHDIEWMKTVVINQCKRDAIDASGILKQYVGEEIK